MDLTEIRTGMGFADTRYPLLSGWAANADCVLVDASVVVVGGGVTGIARPDAGGDVGWSAVAAPDAVAPTVVVVSGNELLTVP